MIRTHAFLLVLIGFLVCIAAGCGEGDSANASTANRTGGDTGAAVGNGDGTGGERALLPALGGFALVLEAESGEVKPPVVVEDFAPKGPGVKQKASGGKCIAVPWGANKECKEKKTEPVGSVELTFEVPEDGTYFIYPRVWWMGEGKGCSNSFWMTLNGGKRISITDATPDAWHWIKLKPLEVGGPKYRPFKLKKGKHTLVFLNREDGTKLDQVYITDDAEDVPAAIMQGVE
jgi:hypothetical protein